MHCRIVASKLTCHCFTLSACLSFLKTPRFVQVLEITSGLEMNNLKTIRENFYFLKTSLTSSIYELNFSIFPILPCDRVSAYLDMYYYYKSVLHWHFPSSYFHEGPHQENHKL